jgi:hypothetical protein
MNSLLSALDFVKVQAALAAQAAATKAALSGLVLVDPAEAVVLGAAPGVDAPPLTYHLTYVDALGHLSQRVITLRRLDPDRNGLKLVCWCHAANAVRCFSLRGIVEVFDIVTGEVHDDAAAFFGAHPLLIDPTDPVDYALRVCKHEVNVLVAVGAADGRFDPDEQDRVLIHVFDRMPELSMSEDLMRDRLCRMTADRAAFEAAMLQLGKFKRGDGVALMRSLRKLVEADGKITREEANFAEEVQRHLTPAAH